jgi:hypothetical protein
MAKALKIIGTVAVVAGLAIVTGGAALGLGLALSTSAFGISAGLLLAAGSVLSAASSLLAPGIKAPKVSSSTADRLQVSINTRAPRLSVFGSTAMGTDLRDQEYSNDQTYLHRWVVSAGHAARAIREIWFDDKLAWSAAGGVTSDFAGYLTVTPVLEGSAANAINTGPRMGSSRRYTGCAYVYFRFKLTGNSKKSDSPFAQSIPSRVTIVGDGMPVYDPRQDSTRGGSGACRADNQATWIRTDEACGNPALQLLTFLIGWRINGRLSVGKGVPPARIDIDSFAVAANICDEPVARSAGGTEMRYRGDGVFSEADELNVVYDTFKATMNAIIDDVGGRQRIQILHNDLGTPIGSLTTADVLGTFTWDQTPALQQTINVIRGGYTDPSSASLFQLIEGPEVRGTSPDGIDRDQKIDLPFVQSPSQRSRLLLMRLQRIISGGGTFTAEFQATGWKFQKGDVVRFTFAPLGWVNKLFRIADMAVQVDGVVPMMLREEHFDIYLGEGNDAAAIVGAEPTRYEWTLNPILQDLDQLAGEINNAAGDAADALDAIAALGDDGVLTVNEKVTKLIPLNSELEAAWQLLDSKAAAISDPEVTDARSIAAGARIAWLTYRNALSPAWNNTSIDTAVARSTFNGKLADYRYGISLLAEALRLYLGILIDGLDQRLNGAIDALDALADDNVITANEKITKLIPLSAEIEATWSALDAQLATISTTEFNHANNVRTQAAYWRGVWLNYLDGLAPAWDDTTTDTPIANRNFYNTVLLNYRDSINAMLDAQRRYGAFKTSQVAGDAEDALDQIQALANDGVLSVNEKITKLIPLNNELLNAWDLLDDQAAAITGFATVTDARATANNARMAWEAYRNSLSPAWNNTLFDTAVDRTLFNGRIADYRFGIDLLADALRKYAGLPPNQGAYKVTAIYSPGTSSPIYAPSGSSASEIYVPAHDVVLSDGRRSGQDFGTFPAGTISGLSPNTSYAIFWDFISSVYLAEAMPAPIGTSNNALIYYPPISTSASGGGYVAPPPPPPGYRGYDGLGRGTAIP